MTARDWRERIRQGEWTGPTAGLAEGYAQANLLALPVDLADTFEEFCRLNPRPCPLLERLPPGEYLTRDMADGADLRTDLPRYQVFTAGQQVAEETSVLDWWAPDLVAYLFGCSFTFEWSLARAGIPLAHVAQGKNVPMYRTTIPLKPVGPFGGNMVVSMRPLPPAQVEPAIAITTRFPRMHGRPVHVGDARVIGIEDLARPDFGDAVEIPHGTVPVFWACGVTTQVAALHAAPWRVIAHAPGHMLLLDRRHEEFEE